MEKNATSQPPRMKLGEILTAAGLLTESNLRKALDVQKESGERLGFILLSQRFISEAQLIQALSKQLSIPWVSLAHLEITPELMKMVSCDLVEKHGVVPVYVMTRRGEKILYVAMDDPTNEEVLRAICEESKLPVKPMIAAPSEIAAAIATFYGRRWEQGEKLRAALRGDGSLAGGAQPSWAAVPPPPPPAAVSAPPPPPASQTSAAPPRPKPLPPTPPPPPQEEGGAAGEGASIPLSQAGPGATAEETFVLPESAVVTNNEEQAVEWLESPAAASTPPPPEKTASAAPRCFTFLDGTRIAFTVGLGFQKIERREADPAALIERALVAHGTGKALAATLGAVYRTLLTKGLMSRSDLQEVLDRIEKA